VIRLEVGPDTSRVSLECSHELKTAEIILGPDWISSFFALPRNNGLDWRIQLHQSWSLSQLDIIGVPVKVWVHCLSHIWLADALFS